MYVKIQKDLTNNYLIIEGKNVEFSTEKFEVDFKDYFEKHAGPPQNHIYPTVTIRQIMWALKMKPLKRQPWETAFDKCPI